jgi:hypothetical protein
MDTRDCKDRNLRQVCRTSSIFVKERSEKLSEARNFQNHSLVSHHGVCSFPLQPFHIGKRARNPCDAINEPRPLPSVSQDDLRVRLEVQHLCLELSLQLTLLEQSTSHSSTNARLNGLITIRVCKGAQ